MGSAEDCQEPRNCQSFLALCVRNRHHGVLVPVNVLEKIGLETVKGNPEIAANEAYISPSVDYTNSTTGLSTTVPQ